MTLAERWDRLRAWHPALLYPLAFAALFTLGVAFGLVAKVDRAVTPESLDERVLSWVVHHRDQHPAVTAGARIVTRAGNPVPGFVAVLAVGLLLWRWPSRWGGDLGWREVVFWIVANGGGRLLSLSLKAWFQRERPPELDRLVAETSFSFPSGHSMGSAVFFGLLAIFFAMTPAGRSWRARSAVGVACLLLASAIASSRIWLGVHYFTDVLGGLVIGLGWAAVAGAIHLRWRLTAVRTSR